MACKSNQIIKSEQVALPGTAAAEQEGATAERLMRLISGWILRDATKVSC